MSAGSSAADHGAQLRADARQGRLWRRVLTWLGVRAHTARADAQARAWQAGAVGEEATAGLLAPLEAAGWVVLHDRRVPGARTANADHVLISPGARVFLVDSKLWSRQGRVRVVGGRMMHGARDVDRDVDNAVWEANLVGWALGVHVTPILAVHNAPIDGGGMRVRGVAVLPAGSLVPVLREQGGRPVKGARFLADLAEQRMPRYTERSGR